MFFVVFVFAQFSQKCFILYLRICGLDPAYLSFYPTMFSQYLSHSDATFVDIIQTDAGSIGMPIGTGTANFLPNAGISFQPGCPLSVFFPLTLKSTEK